MTPKPPSKRAGREKHAKRPRESGGVASHEPQRANAGASRRASAGWGGADWAVCAGLAIAVLAVFGRVAGHQFLHFDDNEYIYENPHVRTGLTGANIAWAMTAFHSNNWHPLTWISHMVDSQWFGMNAGPHHLVNVLLHAANVVVLFVLLQRLTGARWRSAFVAAAFALHPLRVESIAWASERKDVLSALFGLVTVALYAAYAKRPGLVRYAAVVVAFALGLMAKPMLVTLPFVLLLLDVWPLRRPGIGAPARRSDVAPARGGERGATAPLPWLDKLPLVALVVASSALTLAAQSKGGVVRSLEDLSPAMRVANALVSFVRYAGKLLVPVQQAFYYPYPRELPVAAAAGAAVVLALITWLVVRGRARRPWAFVGWFWYLGMLVPVIGLIQVATQSIADRYSYLPSIGFFIVVAWGVAEWVERRPAWRAGVATVAVVALAACAFKAWAQTAYWRDGITLFTRDTQVIRDNPLGYRNLGVALSDSGRAAEAVTAFTHALARYPKDPVTLYDIGSALEKSGRFEEAEARYRESLSAKPDQPDALYNLANVLNRRGRADEAIETFRTAIRLRPAFAAAHNNLGNALGRRGRADESIAEYREALRLDPNYVEAYNNLGTTLRSAGRLDEAEQQFQRALTLKPGFAAAEFNLGIIALQRGDTAQSRRRFDRAVTLDPALAANLNAIRR